MTGKNPCSEAISYKMLSEMFKLGKDCYVKDGNYIPKFDSMNIYAHRTIGRQFFYGKIAVILSFYSDEGAVMCWTMYNELVPIVCVGETFDEYHDKKTEVIIIGQVTKALEDIKLKENQRIVIAYEPVWVIGSGQAIRHNIVEYIIQIIIHTTIDLDQSFADKFQVIYGGSVDEKNINDFIIGNILTGVIVGNNSLKVDSFMKIVQNIKL